MIFDRKTIIDYINGRISDNNKKVLENNPNFMKKVIELTNDIKMYDNCSEELKGNYIFVYDLTKKYIDNLPFIEKIIFNFILFNKENNLNESIELTIMLLLNTPYEERKLSDCLDVYSFYKYYMNHVEIALNDEENYDILNELGKGFIFLYYEFENYPNIVEFFAIEYLKEMFFSTNSFIEDLMHRKFKNKEELEKIGINTFLINYIAVYDPMLSNYVSLRLYLLDDIKLEIEKTKDNWDNKLKQIDSIRKMFVEEEIKKYMKSKQYNNSFNCYKELRDVLEELRIDYNLDKYDLTDTDYITNDKCINFSKILFKNKIKKLLNVLYETDYIDLNKIRALQKSKKNTEIKVYKLDFSKKNQL